MQDKPIVNVFLSRRNLLSLLVKLDRPGSHCTIVKSDTMHPTHPQTGAEDIWVTAIEDDVYYVDREPGVMYEELIPMGVNND